MAEIIQKYDTRLRGRDERRYMAQACGRMRDDGMWEGWLEFLPLEPGIPVVSHRETTQPNREDLVYWASGLTDPYLDGALLRALTVEELVPAPEPGAPVSEGPAPHRAAAARPASTDPPRAVLDPFHVHAEGDDILRAQLNALSPGLLRNIVRAYQLSALEPGDLALLSKQELVTLIIEAVERGATR